MYGQIAFTTVCSLSPSHTLSLSPQPFRATRAQAGAHERTQPHAATRGHTQTDTRHMFCRTWVFNVRRFPFAVIFLNPVFRHGCSWIGNLLHRNPVRRPSRVMTSPEERTSAESESRRLPYREIADSRQEGSGGGFPHFRHWVDVFAVVYHTAL